MNPTPMYLSLPGHNAMPMVDATKSRLFGLWALGQAVRIYSAEYEGMVYGLIQAVAVESGYSEGCPPSLFNVTVRLIAPTRKAGTKVGDRVTVFVRTID